MSIEASNVVTIMKQALELLKKLDRDLIIETWELAKVMGSLEQAIATAVAEPHKESSATQEPVAHCEAGKDYCQQCLDEDVNTPLDAAVRYIKNNTPKVVSDEICKALTHPQPKQPLLSDEDCAKILELAEKKAGLSHNAWDMVDPLELIAFIVSAAHGIGKGEA